MTVEMTEPEDLPTLDVAISVPEHEPNEGNGSALDDEVTVEMTLDGDIVVIAAWPNDGEPVDRDTLMQTLMLAQQSLPQILDRMENPQ